VVWARREEIASECKFPGLGLTESIPVELDDKVVELDEEASNGERESTTDAVVDATGMPVKSAVEADGPAVIDPAALTVVTEEAASAGLAAPARSR